MLDASEIGQSALLNKLAFWGAGVSIASKENVNRPMWRDRQVRGQGLWTGLAGAWSRERCSHSVRQEIGSHGR